MRSSCAAVLVAFTTPLMLLLLLLLPSSERLLPVRVKALAVQVNHHHSSRQQQQQQQYQHQRQRQRQPQRQPQPQQRPDLSVSMTTAKGGLFQVHSQGIADIFNNNNEDDATNTAIQQNTDVVVDDNQKLVKDLQQQHVQMQTIQKKMLQPHEKPQKQQQEQCSYEIRSKYWNYKSRYQIAYEVARATTSTTNIDTTNDRGSIRNHHCNTSDSNNEQPILLLNGFGVGSFHQHRLIPELFTKNNDPHRTVYCMDYVGQGQSWPQGCNNGLGENEKDLQYSADTWCEQIIDFIEAIVLSSTTIHDDDDGSRCPPTPTQVHLVGNSVGGHLAAHVAVRRPDLVASLCLLNPTPVWGANLPGWDAHLPVPAIPKLVVRSLFDQIRDLHTIEESLNAAYSRREAFTDELVHQIRDCTLGKGGQAALASIMWSPPLISGTTKGGKGDFYDCLTNVSCDVLLVFGTDDPWCQPCLARSMLVALNERREEGTRTTTDIRHSSHNKNNDGRHSQSHTRPRTPVHRYVEISHAGHCPHHEAPQAVGHLVNQWVTVDTTLSLTQPHARAQPQSRLSFVEAWGETIVQERQMEDIPLDWFDKIVTYIVGGSTSTVTNNDSDPLDNEQTRTRTDQTNNILYTQIPLLIPILW
eukprot:CAMPEP_0170794572 /NCGR_PEP_ID=MMETSP0733-20121128/23491_1 /TAXON_ID=186038 /ORGANISM="Fragilariopsis kerguelensis, Strain L26-C5" /LENGTH=639 /DNA_ID=CAMNT_0011144061 /DNA_START=218 /DNA_END=2137 /DNA_ORIENTATION=+